MTEREQRDILLAIQQNTGEFSVVFLVIDSSFDETPAGPEPLATLRVQSTPYKETNPLLVSPVEDRMAELSRQVQRVAQTCNRIVIEAGDCHRQLKSIGLELETIRASASGPAMTIEQAIRIPARGALQHAASQAARADLTTEDSRVRTMSTTQIRHFWERVSRTEDHWVWRGMIDPRTRRGMLRVNGKLVYAHRVCYTLHTGDPLEGINLKSICSEPVCVRPDHQRPGSLGAALRGTPRDRAVQESLHPEDNAHENYLERVAYASAAPPSGDDVPLTTFEQEVTRLFGEPESPQNPRNPWSVEQIRATDPATYAKDRWGHQALCRRGHRMTIQPGGRRTCKTCDLERKRKSLAVQTQINQTDREQAATRQALAEGISEIVDETRYDSLLDAQGPQEPYDASDTQSDRIGDVLALPAGETWIVSTTSTSAPPEERAFTGIHPAVPAVLSPEIPTLPALDPPEIHDRDVEYALGVASQIEDRLSSLRRLTLVPPVGDPAYERSAEHESTPDRT